MLRLDTMYLVGLPGRVNDMETVMFVLATILLAISCFCAGHARATYNEVKRRLGKLP